MADLRTRPDRWAQASGGLVTWTTGNLSAGRRLWRLITEPSRSLGMRLLAHVILAKIELTNGRWRAAERGAQGRSRPWTRGRRSSTARSTP